MNNLFLPGCSTRIAVVLCAIVAAALPSRAEAALDALAVIIGESQGQIVGDVDIPPNEGKIRIKAFGGSMSAVYDAASGVPGSGKQHRPVRLLKDVDRTSPQLLAAFKNNERLLAVTLEFYRPTQAGAEENYLTIVLQNAYIVSLLPSSSSQEDDLTIPFRETISLTYESMTVTWESSGVSTQIDW